jgi:Diiron non-heme beta-hydroxylase N-terminal domain
MGSYIQAPAAQYAEVPDILKGYVELVYDLNNQASFRLFETLLYKSKFYNPKAQSISLWLTENDERPFALSTPKLNEEHIINLEIPFNHLGLDALSKMKRTSNTVDNIKKILDIPIEQEALFNTFFTQEAPKPYENYTGDKVRMRYFGHACILLSCAFNQKRTKKQCKPL